MLQDAVAEHIVEAMRPKRHVEDVALKERDVGEMPVVLPARIDGGSFKRCGDLGSTPPEEPLYDPEAKRVRL